MRIHCQIFWYLLFSTSLHATSSNDALENNLFIFDSIPAMHDIEECYLNGRFDSAIKLCNISSNYFESSHDWLNYSKVKLKMSSINRMSGYFKRTYHLIDEVNNIINKNNLNDSLLLSEYILESAILYQYLGQYEKSISLLDSGIQLIPFADKYILLHKYYNAYGLNCKKLSKLDEALDFYKMAIQIKSEYCKTDDIEVANYLKNVSNTYLRLGDTQSSLDYCLVALNKVLNIGDSSSVMLVPMYRLFGNINYVLGNYDQSLAYYMKALQIISYHKKDSSFFLQDIYNNLGNLFYKKGNFIKSIEYYEMAFKIMRTNDYPDNLDFINYNYKLGLLNFQSQEYLVALDKFFEGLKISLESYNYYLPNFYHAIAGCYLGLKKLDSAKFYYKKAISERIKFYGADNIYLAYDYQNYGLFCLKEQDKDTGLMYINKALDIYRNKYDLKHPAVAQLYCDIGNFYFDKSDYIAALDYYQKSLNSIIDDYYDSSYLSNPYLNQIDNENNTLLCVRKKAETLAKLSEKYPENHTYQTLSLETYNLAIDLIDRIRISYADYESKINISENEGAIYRDAMEVALVQYSNTGDESLLEKVFMFAEKSKAAILSAAIHMSEAKITSGLPSELIQKEKEVVQSIGTYQRMINEEKYKTNSDSIKLDLWSNKLFELKLERDRLIDYLEKNFPSYYELKYRPYVTNIATLQQSLYENEALIEYVINDSSLFIFCITSGNIDIQTTFVDSIFYQNLEYLLHALYGKGILEGDNMTYGGFTDASFNLYNSLMKPVTNLLTGKDLIIIPDEQLSYLPFEVLLTSLPNNQEPYKNLPFLIKDHAIGYSYSATLLSDTRSRKRKQGMGLIAFAPSYPLNDYSNPFPDFKASITRDSLINLPYVREEAEYISNLFGGELFLDNLATESGFKSMASKYNLIHLAMHGLMDEENPMFSKLVFAQSEDSLDDGYLYTYEIYNLNLNAQLAVLSACNTGAGRLVRGEGLMSMARGFYYAGCPSIITTRWSVNDKSSAEIMKRFYDYLAEGESKIEALRLAKLDYLSKSDPWLSHPRYWAAYVSVGEPGALEERKIKYLFFIIPLIIVMFIAVTLYYRKRSRSIY